jgi:GAF domain-containing protein
MTDSSPPVDIRRALAALFVEIGRDLTKATSADEVLETLSRSAYAALPSAEHAAISRRRHGRFETVAATSELPQQIDEIQFRLGSGPGVDALLDRGVYRADELSADRRWPQFGREVTSRFGIHSMLSAQLDLEDDELHAALNLYAGPPHAFDESDETTAVLLATHGALAISAARRQQKVDNLEQALTTSRLIGAATGVLMATYKVTDDQAFDLMRVASQASHRKLRDIAAEVVASGTIELPAPPEPRRL